MRNCPNKNLPEWKALVALIGEANALRAYADNNEEIPIDLSKFKKGKYCRNYADILIDISGGDVRTDEETIEHIKKHVFIKTKVVDKQNISGFDFNGKFIELSYEVPDHEKYNKPQKLQDEINRLIDKAYKNDMELFFKDKQVASIFKDFSDLEINDLNNYRVDELFKEKKIGTDAGFGLSEVLEYLSIYKEIVGTTSNTKSVKVELKKHVILGISYIEIHKINSGGIEEYTILSVNDGDLFRGEIAKKITPTSDAMTDVLTRTHLSLGMVVEHMKNEGKNVLPETIVINRKQILTRDYDWVSKQNEIIVNHVSSLRYQNESHKKFINLHNSYTRDNRKIENYGTDGFLALKSLIQSRNDLNYIYLGKDGDASTATYETLKKTMINRQTFLLKKRDKDTLSSTEREELELISRSILQNSAKENSITDALFGSQEVNIGLFQLWFGNLAKMASDMVKLVYNEVSKAQTATKIALHRFFDEHRGYFERMVNSKGYKSIVYVDNEHRRGMTKHLLHYNDGKFTGRLLNKHDAEWSKLTKEDKEYIAFVIKTIKDRLAARHKSMSEVEFDTWYKNNWIDGDLPLMKKREGDMVRDAMNGKVKEALWDNGVKAWYDNATELRLVSSDESRFEKGIGMEDEFFDGKLSRNVEARLRMLESGNMETGVETIMSYMMENSMAKEHMDDVLHIYNAVKETMERSKGMNGKIPENNIKAIDMIIKSAVYGERVRAQWFDKLRNRTKGYVDIDKIVSALTRFTSMIGVKYNVFAAIKNMLYNAIGRDGRDLISGLMVRGDISAKSRAEAYKYMLDPTKSKLIHAISKQFGMVGDFTDVMRDNRITGMTAKEKLDDLGFYVTRKGDEFYRIKIMVAQMIEDGTLEAYHLDKDGNLVYTKSKDKRRAKADAKIMEVIDKNNANDKLGEQAYDLKEMRKLKALGDNLYGNYDKNTQRLYNMTALGSLVGQFRKYMPALFEEYWRGKSKDNLVGKYIINSKGEVEWASKETVGYVPALYYLVKDAAKNIRNGKPAFADVDINSKESASKLLVDIILFSLLGTLYAVSAGDGDDDDDKTITGFAKLDGKLDSLRWEIMGGLNPNTYMAVFSNPMASYMAYKKSKKLIEHMVMLEEEEIKKTLGSMTPFVNVSMVVMKTLTPALSKNEKKAYRNSPEGIEEARLRRIKSEEKKKKRMEAIQNDND